MGVERNYPSARASSSTSNTQWRITIPLSLPDTEQEKKRRHGLNVSAWQDMHTPAPQAFTRLLLHLFKACVWATTVKAIPMIIKMGLVLSFGLLLNTQIYSDKGTSVCMCSQSSAVVELLAHSKKVWYSFSLCAVPDSSIAHESRSLLARFKKVLPCCTGSRWTLNIPYWVPEQVYEYESTKLAYVWM